MDENENTDLEQQILEQPVNIAPLNHSIDELAHQIVEEQDVSTTKDLVELFNWNLSKKNAIRLLKLNGLYDKITDQMIERFNRRAGEFSNADLLNYLQTIENSMEKTQKGLSNAEEQKQIQIQNNTQVNVNVVDTFDSESKDRIAEAIKAILGDTAEDKNVINVENFTETKNTEDN